MAIGERDQSSDCCDPSYEMYGLFVSLLLIFKANSEIKMVVGRVEKIVFTGDILYIRLDNYHLDQGLIKFCFTGVPSQTSIHCPRGYSYYVEDVSTVMKTYTYRITRSGKVLTTGDDLRTLRFNDDGSLDFLVAMTPKRLYVTLVNAERFVPTTTTVKTTTQETTSMPTVLKQRSNTVLFAVIAGLVTLAVGLIAAFLLWYFCCRT
uniref:DUF4793 domain-containing protein n=1 Tax=Panagrellus redivivus TaxID=6233 RepID=A0A7E4VVP4_PANRE